MIFKKLLICFVTALFIGLTPIQAFASDYNPRDLVDVLEPDISDEDLYNLALVCLAEAEGETELGKRLVIDVVLNRVDSSKFPNDISKVIYQKNQFSSMRDGGRKDRVTVDEKTLRLVKEELLQRTNYEVLYFRNKHYHNFGTPMFQEDHHYFSK